MKSTLLLSSSDKSNEVHVCCKTMEEGEKHQSAKQVTCITKSMGKIIMGRVMSHVVNSVPWLVIHLLKIMVM